MTRPGKPCADNRRLVRRLFDEGLTKIESKRLGLHIRWCDACRGYYRGTRDVVVALDDASIPKPPRAVQERMIREALAEAAARASARRAKAKRRGKP